MRLLSSTSDGTLSLTEFFGDKIPKYAILSHTWGADSEEVTFKDIIDGLGKDKAGYSKIQFCGELAKRNGLQYFWVDTCCIDKSSGPELSEAINSMFRWYHNATACYVYLLDVSVPNSEEDENYGSLFEAAFKKSRWFTRGWTLQELIAPRLVEFFAVNRKRLGDKKSLERMIGEITGIDAQALRGNDLSDFTIAERISWAAKRETKREEDKAYALLGILDITMSLRYGEGRENALARVQRKAEKSQNIGGEDGFPETSQEAAWADEWMEELEKIQYRSIQSYDRDRGIPLIRIAVLSTGIDLNHSLIKGAFRTNRIRACRSFVPSDNSITDSHGYGTHVAALLLKVAPDAQLYIAKIAKNGSIPSDHKISNAINWAIDSDIDIIIMPFGLNKDDPSMQYELMRAYAKNILLFAAGGHNHSIPFPARKSEVFSIFATDGKGSPYECNPYCLDTKGYKFATLGAAVNSAWPVSLLPTRFLNKRGERRRSGTDISTAIVAGIAAFILDFVLVRNIDTKMYQMLRTRDGMERIFAKLVTSDSGGLDYILPRNLFADHRSDDTIMVLIIDVLAAWV